MKRFVLLALLMMVGVYFIYQGSIALTTPVRGEVALYLVRMLIPANDLSLYTFGSVFVALGALLLASPFLLKKIMK